MKYISLIFAVFLLFAGSSFSQTENYFAKANDYYQKGHYSKAAELYEKMVKSGYESPEVLFNLGNSYFKLKKIPHSLLYYERAKLLAPNDEDINFNISIANLQIVDKIEPVPKFFLYEWADSIESSYSSSAWSLFGIILIWILFISLAVFFFFWQSIIKRISFTIAALALIASIFCFTFAVRSNIREISRNGAIIFTPAVYVKSSPDEGSTDLFLLHEGTKVKIEDNIGEWSKIKIANGSVGWLKNHDFVVI